MTRWIFNSLCTAKLLGPDHVCNIAHYGHHFKGLKGVIWNPPKGADSHYKGTKLSPQHRLLWSPNPKDLAENQRLIIKLSHGKAIYFPWKPSQLHLSLVSKTFLLYLFCCGK